MNQKTSEKLRQQISSLHIGECEAAQHEEICRLLVSSFRGKFGAAESPHDERMAQLLAAAWPYRREAYSLQLGASIEKTARLRSDDESAENREAETVGTIGLKWRASGVQGEDFIRSEPSLTALIAKFGLRPALRLLIGMAVIHYTPSVGEGYIEHLAVRADCRGLGIGRKLMLIACEQAAGKGLRSCTLHVSKNNSAAVALYESLGFVSARAERRFACGWLFGEYDWLLMKKEITLC